MELARRPLWLPGLFCDVVDIEGVGMIPEFPNFKAIELQDRDLFQEYLTRYPPEISELSFTNLFIWRKSGGLNWSIYRDWLLLQSQDAGGIYFYPPIGPAPRQEVVRFLLDWMRTQPEIAVPRIERAERALADEFDGAADLTIEPTRDQFDYIYRSEDLIKLAGRKYHRKRNHLKHFMEAYPDFIYTALTPEHMEACRAVARQWYCMNRCEDDMDLLGELEAVESALENFAELQLSGGVIYLRGEIVAFTVGEKINPTTAVIHIEKADPDIQGLYAMVNQRFCEQCWGEVEFINREQDLGDPGLRQAKESYYPERLVEKFRITVP